MVAFRVATLNKASPSDAFLGLPKWRPGWRNDRQGGPEALLYLCKIVIREFARDQRHRILLGVTYHRMRSVANF
jgi:hypothetical protein